MLLFDLLVSAGIPYDSQKLQNVNITGITDDSRKVSDGYLFVCVDGKNIDGHIYAAECIQKGCAAVVTSKPLGLANEINLQNISTRTALGNLASAWFSHPEKSIRLIGVTGTKGKSTITTLIKHILTNAGHKTALIGTVRNEIGNTILPSKNSTPFPMEFFELMRMAVDEGCSYLVMEVSSFGLDQERMGNCTFEVGAFTNLSQDHLDYHGDMENYYNAKKIFCSMSRNFLSGIDNTYGMRMFKELKDADNQNIYSYSAEDKNDADFLAIPQQNSMTATGSSFEIHDKKTGLKQNVNIKLPGLFNIKNALAAFAICSLAGVKQGDICNYLETITGVRGRFEVLPTNGKNFTVISDYAHTPDSLENVLSSIKNFIGYGSRLICLFGCGGNRDRTKRPIMAKVAAKYADLVIVTSDNPRDEHPQDIINDIIAGFDPKNDSFVVIEDRVEAIKFGMDTANKSQYNDILLLAGKGQEDYQILSGGKTIPMDEVKIVKELLVDMTI